VRRLLTGLVDTDLADPNRCGCLIINTTVEFGNRDEEVEKLVSRSLGETEALLRASFDKALDEGEIAAGQIHAIPPFSVDHIRSPGQPRPLAPPPLRYAGIS
jgi:TetR/AcrR family transcriptional repressor of nem operon